MPKSFAPRLLLYALWAALALAAVTALMRAHLPHWGLFAGALFLVAGIGLLSAGELAPWAARRSIPRPQRFALRVWLASSIAWAVYVGLVSLPLAFFTTIPATKSGRDLLGVLTFALVPLFYALAWWATYRAARPRARVR